MDILLRAGVILAGLAVLCLAIPGCVSRASFRPKRAIAQTPADFGWAFEPVVFRTTGSPPAELHGWFIKSASAPAATVLHYHGNTGNIATCLPGVGWLSERGFNVFLFDYRGYGASSGEPSFRGLVEDSACALEYLRSRPDAGAVVIWGQSLGGTLALAALARVRAPEVKAAVVESAFYSYREMAQDTMRKRWDPAGAFLSRFFVSDEDSIRNTITNLPPVPLLIVHGTNDASVKISHAQRIFADAPEPKSAMWVDGGHLAAFRSDATNRARLVDFLLGSVRPPAPPPAR